MIRYRDDLTKRTWLEQARTEEIDLGEQSESRTDAETVTTALKSTLKAAYDADIELTRSFSCNTDPSYPDWDVTIAEVNRRVKRRPHARAEENSSLLPNESRGDFARDRYHTHRRGNEETGNRSLIVEWWVPIR